MKLNRENIVVFLISLGFLSSVYVLFNRWKIEKENNEYEIAIDYQDLIKIAEENSRVPLELSDELKKAGITTIGIEMENLRNFEEEGRVVLASYQDIEKLVMMGDRLRFLLEMEIPNRPNLSYIFVKEPELGEWIKNSLKKKFGEKEVLGFYRGPYYLVMVSRPKRVIENVYLGFWNERIEEVKELNLKILLKFGYDNFMKKEFVETLKDVEIGDITCISFTGSSIPDEGRGFLKEFIKRNNIKIGVVEFLKVKGLKSFLKDYAYNVIGIHSIGRKKVDKETTVERMIRAVRERNMRILYLHPFDYSLPDFINIITEIRDGLKEKGFYLGDAKPFEKFKVKGFFLFLISISVFSCIYWILRIVFKLSLFFEISYVVIAVGLSILFSKDINFRLLVSFLSTVSFPVLAISKPWKRRKINEFLHSILLFLGISGISFIGAFSLAGLLSQNLFFTKIYIFRGVKLSLILPLFISFLILYGRDRTYFTSGLERIWKKRVEVRHLFLGGIVLLGIIFLLLRAGNTPGFSIPGERMLRNLLDKIFYVRPRFKEFLFGHPLMLLGIYMYLSKKKHPFRSFLIFGLIGQVSIINTFAHLHTPLFISILRSINGIFLGIFFGIVLIKIYEILYSK